MQSVGKAILRLSHPEVKCKETHDRNSSRSHPETSDSNPPAYILTLSDTLCTLSLSSSSSAASRTMQDPPDGPAVLH